MTTDLPQNDRLLRRVHLEIEGIVQGIGFRPFIYQLAHALDLTGWVCNSPKGVEIEIEGSSSQIQAFLERLESEKPPLSRIDQLDLIEQTPQHSSSFSIIPSKHKQKVEALILPELATCPQCITDIFDEHNRRYHYPFTNCTNCGPRYTIISALPYDRRSTSMHTFEMCEDCRKEYENPLDRRFHAQPNACPKCGPHLSLLSPDGKTLATHDEALQLTRNALKKGKIIALMGLGGFQLVVDATLSHAISSLRRRKNRPKKPLALMLPSTELIEKLCFLSPTERNILSSPQAPILLLLRHKHPSLPLAFEVAFDNPYLGIMLPTTPLHHLLFTDHQLPLVVTSGNISDNPLSIHIDDALHKLGNIADLFLVHNRPILRPIDDSVARIIDDKIQILRRARGYAPLPLFLHPPQLTMTPHTTPKKALALGADLKATFALQKDKKAILSPYIGDLHNAENLQLLEKHLDDLTQLQEIQPTQLLCDLHPDYQSTLFAENYASQNKLPLQKVQHHIAHALACIAEHNPSLPLTAIVWDGTGWGLDSTIWGGETFSFSENASISHVLSIRSFQLIGGEQAVREPRRIALALLQQLSSLKKIEPHLLDPLLLQLFAPSELDILQQMLHKKIRTFTTSSIGRLFDGIAALLGFSQKISFEGEAAISLEHLQTHLADPRLASTISNFSTYPIHFINSNDKILFDWIPMLFAIFQELHEKTPRDIIARRFHLTMTQLVLLSAQKIGHTNVILTGGCFQNTTLLQDSISLLRQHHFNPIWPQQIPPNDSSIALGQLLAPYFRHPSA